MFWVLAAILALAAAGIPLFALTRARAPLAPRAAHEMESLKAQIGEAERDAARGLISPAEAEAAKLELGRRLIAASERAERESAESVGTGAFHKNAAFGIGAALIALSFGVYAYVGAPGAADQPLASRGAEGAAIVAAAKTGQSAGMLSQIQAQTVAAARGVVKRPTIPPPEPGQPDIAALYGRLKDKLKEHPDDPQGLRLLATFGARLGHYEESWPAWSRLLAQTPDAPGDDYSSMGEAMVQAAGGYVSPEAQTAFEEALKRDAKLAGARYYLGLADVQQGDPRRALTRWAELLREGGPDAPWVARLSAEAVDAAREAKIDPATVLPDFALPKAAPPGPSAADVAAAAGMSEGDRTAMIQTMVARLADKLKENPKDLEGWLRLIRAYGVMGKTEERASAFVEARKALAEDAAALAALDAAEKAAP